MRMSGDVHPWRWEEQALPEKVEGLGLNAGSGTRGLDRAGPTAHDKKAGLYFGWDGQPLQF